MPEIPLIESQYAEALSWARRIRDENTRHIQLKAIVDSAPVEGDLFMVNGDPLTIFSSGRSVLGEVAPRMIYAESQRGRLEAGGFLPERSVTQPHQLYFA